MLFSKKTIKTSILKQIILSKYVTQQKKSLSTDSVGSICAKLNDENKNVIYSWKENGSFHVQLNNPKKRNAFNLGMYQSIGKALKTVSGNEQVKCVIFKGKEGFYSSGNDLSYLKDIPKNELQTYIIKTINAMDAFINELIEIDKPIIAAIDGPAIGIGCSTLGLFDLIICSSRAEFSVPFSLIGLVPEGCSSYTFPRILGSIRANQMLLFNHKLDAESAHSWGFVSQLVKSPVFEEALDEFENYITTICNKDSIIKGKRLVRNDEIREKLKKVNQTEGELMKEFWGKPAYQNYLNKFYKNKN